MLVILYNLSQCFRYLCASYLSLTAMDQQHCVAYAARDATDTSRETSTPQHLSPTIESKTSAVSYENPAWNTELL